MLTPFCRSAKCPGERESKRPARSTDGGGRENTRALSAIHQLGADGNHEPGRTMGRKSSFRRTRGHSSRKMKAQASVQPRGERWDPLDREPRLGNKRRLFLHQGHAAVLRAKWSGKEEEKASSDDGTQESIGTPGSRGRGSHGFLGQTRLREWSAERQPSTRQPGRPQPSQSSQTVLTKR